MRYTLDDALKDSERLDQLIKEDDDEGASSLERKMLYNALESVRSGYPDEHMLSVVINVQRKVFRRW